MIELTIFLALAGAVIGAVYYAAGYAIDNYREKKLKTQILTVALNMRKAYSISGLPNGGGPPNYYIGSDVLLKDGIAPPGMIRKNTWQLTTSYGTMSVQSLSTIYRVTVSDLSRAACINTLISTLGTRAAVDDFGIQKVDAYNNGAHTGTSWAASGFNMASATNLCRGTSNVNTLSFHFLLNI